MEVEVFKLPLIIFERASGAVLSFDPYLFKAVKSLSEFEKNNYSISKDS